MYHPFKNTKDNVYMPGFESITKRIPNWSCNLKNFWDPRIELLINKEWLHDIINSDISTSQKITAVKDIIEWYQS